MNFKEITLRSNRVFNGRIINVSHDEIMLSNDQPSHREVVEHPGGVCVAAKNANNNYLMVKQYRYGVKETTLEFVAGKKETNEPNLITASRELEEETGFIAREIQSIGEFFPSPAYLNERIELFVASDLTFKGQHLDHGELLEVVELPLNEIINKIQSNEIKDGKTIALAFYLMNQ